MYDFRTFIKIDFDYYLYCNHDRGQAKGGDFSTTFPNTSHFGFPRDQLPNK